MGDTRKKAKWDAKEGMKSLEKMAKFQSRKWCFFATFKVDIGLE